MIILFVFNKSSIMIAPISNTNKVSESEINISESEIEKIISELKPCSYGPDDVPYIFVKNLRENLCPMFSILFRKSLDEGFVPSQFKLAKVTPIYKNAGQKTMASSYRPISVTSLISRIFERIIRGHMLTYLISNNIIYPDQHGFVPGKSTLTNLICFYDKVTRSLDSGNAFDVVFIVFKNLLIKFLTKF